METKTLTIGQLAKLAGMRTSALRYYEDQGLLHPVSRTKAGYRLYSPEAEQTLHFIQRAQRLGLSLSDIGILLKGIQQGSLTKDEILQTINHRYLALERQVTEGLVLRHEMGQFLQELQEGILASDNLPANTVLERLLDQVCANPVHSSDQSMLNWLVEYAGCQLTTEEGQKLINRLRGQHVHIWKEENAYHILVVSKDPDIESTLRQLTLLENNCRTHAGPHTAPELHTTDEGYLLIASGENAFIYARLFLSLAENSEISLS